MGYEYRAWYKDTKTMYDVFYVNWDTKEAGIYLGGTCTVVPLDSIHLMRNTHLRDISGQEVYEGDFIESHQGTLILDILMLIKYGTYEEYCPADKVYMEGVGFYVEAVNYPQMPVGPLSDYAKVIGNIYENSDWMKKVDCDIDNRRKK